MVVATTRRDFLRSGSVAAAGLYIQQTTGNLQAADSLVSAKHYEVKSVRRTTVRVPYRDVPRRNMDRELPHWRYSEICEVELASGVVGIGETMLYYTWGVPSEDAVKRVYGKNALQIMWDDSLGAGLQMALFDAVAKTSTVPIHCLLGNKINDRTPLSWWNIDTSAADMASECREAMRLGYKSYKTKGRPWFDIWNQVEQACEVVPAWFKIDMDFNDTLLTADRGMPIIKDLEKYPQVDIYESPIPQGDIEGNRKICDATRVNIAMHYGNPKPAIAVRERVCDGFVIGGGATRLMRSAHFAADADLPFWLQLVGTGITAAFSLHFGGVLSHATWPAVNCHQLYKSDLLSNRIEVTDGLAKVPDEVGLGYELDRDTVQRLRVPRPKARPEPERLVETSYPSGKKIYSASDGKVNFMLRPGMQGKYPYYERGADSRAIPNDGSSRWRTMYERARTDGPTEGDLS